MKLIAFFKYLGLALLIICLLICFVGAYGENKINTNLITMFGNYEKVVVVYKENNKTYQTKTIKYNKYKKEDESEILRILKKENYEGFVLHFSKEVGFDYFKKTLGVNLTSHKQIGNTKVCYGYTQYYNDFIICANKKVNVQLAQNESGWILGFPAILTGF